MAESTSTPGKLEIHHEAGDTFKRLFTIREGGVPVDFTGATIEFIITNKLNGALLVTLNAGNGLAASNLAAGEIKFDWPWQAILKPGMTYYYKLKVTFPNGDIKTYLEDLLKTS